MVIDGQKKKSTNFDLVTWTTDFNCDGSIRGNDWTTLVRMLSSVASAGSDDKNMEV